MIRALTVLAATLAATPALAADYEFNLEVGTVRNSDVSWDLFSKRNGMPSYGFRLGAPVASRLTLVGGWHRIRRGRDLYADGDLQARAAFMAHQVQLGAKVDVPIAGFFHPYATAQGLALIASWRFDDDPDDKDSPGQMAGSDVSYGAMGALGVEFHLPDGEAPVRAAVYLEGGYTWIAEMVVCPVGNMVPGGLSVTAGVGVRF